MRLLVDMLIAVMLVGVLAGILVYQRSERYRVDRVEAVQQAVLAIKSESLYRAALGEVEATPRGFSRIVRITWFDHEPRNLIADEKVESALWIEHIDDKTQRDMANPSQIVADYDHPPFWYNPYHGAVRARVPMQLSRQGTVELYNQINKTQVKVSDVEWPSRRFLAQQGEPKLVHEPGEDLYDDSFAQPRRSLPTPPRRTVQQ